MYKKIIITLIIMLLILSSIPIVNSAGNNKKIYNKNLEDNKNLGVKGDFEKKIYERDVETYDYIIITTSEFSDEFQVLADWKATRASSTPYDDLSTRVVLLEDIITNPDYWYNGIWGDGGPENIFNDIQCQIRNFIKMAHSVWDVKYVLLGGDIDSIPTRKIYWIGGNDFASDTYYAGLSGNWNNNRDSNWGDQISDLDFDVEVYVGRAPVNSIIECNNFVRKTISFEQSYNDDYLKNMLSIGEYFSPYKEESYNNDKISNTIPQYTTIKTYERDSLFYEGDISNIKSIMENNGVQIVIHNGHAEKLRVAGFNHEDTSNLQNDKYFLFYSTGCNSAEFDWIAGSWESVGEEFVTAQNGAFAYIGNSRGGFYDYNSHGSVWIQKQFFNLLNTENSHIGNAFFMSKNPTDINNIVQRFVAFSLNLFGDPETQITTEFDTPTVRLNLYSNYNIVSPIMLKTTSPTIKGTVERGTISGSTFSYYTVEYGEGNNPNTWNLIDTVYNEVDNDILTTWDTSSIDDGVYTLRLTAYDNNGDYSYDDFVVIVKKYQNVVNMNTNQNYYSIQTAVSSASEHDLIVVDGNINYERVNIKKDHITLKGINNAVFDNWGRANEYPYYCVYTYKDYATVEGFTFRNGGTGILTESKHNKLDNNVFIDVENGIKISRYFQLPQGGEKATITNNTFSNCNNGIITYYPYRNENIIYNNTIEDCNTGISLSYSDNNIVYNNTIEDGSIGIYLENCNENSIYKNTITEFSKAILIKLCGDNNIFKNIIENNNIAIKNEYGRGNNLFYGNIFINNNDLYYTYGSDPDIWYNEDTNIGNYYDDFEDNIYFPNEYKINNNNIDIYPNRGDLDYNCDLNMNDFLLLYQMFGTSDNPLYDPKYDYDNDGVISHSDVRIWSTFYNEFIS